MSQENAVNDTVAAAAAEEVNEYKKLDPMTREEFQEAERKIQLGISDTLPDGRKVSEVQKNLEATQLAQEKERREKYMPKPKEASKTEKLEVLVAENGSISARPPAAAVKEKSVAGGGGDDSSPESDLPQDFPARDKLIAAGVTSLEMVAGLKHEDLTGISGIKDATAEKILSYGKSE